MKRFVFCDLSVGILVSTVPNFAVSSILIEVEIEAKRQEGFVGDKHNEQTIPHTTVRH